MQKLIVLSISAVLFLAVLFLDQNRAPVPVKLILGDPTPIGLSFVMLFSMFSQIEQSLAVAVAHARERSSYEQGIYRSVFRHIYRRSPL